MEKVEELFKEIKSSEVSGIVEHLEVGQNGFLYVELRNESENMLDKHFAISPEVLRESGLNQSSLYEDMEIVVELNRSLEPIRVKRLNIQ